MAFDQTYFRDHVLLQWLLEFTAGASYFLQLNTVYVCLILSFVVAQC